MNKTKTTEVHERRVERNNVRMVVKAKISGKPRFKFGVWLIKMGVWLSQVHVRVWIEQERKK